MLDHIKMSSSKSILLFGLLYLATGCTKSTSGARSVDISTNLVLTGRILDTSSSPVQNAQIFLGNVSEAQAQTKSDGSFSISLNENELSKAVAATGESVQKLFVATLKNSPIRLIGLSDSVDLRIRGTQEIGEIRLGIPATLKGSVLSQDLGQRSKPVAGAIVKVGRSKSTTLVDGTFEVSDLPAGTSIATVSSSNLQTTTVDVKFYPGEALALERPIVLFPGNAIAGIIQPMPVGDLHALAQSGHPYQRTFQIFKSERAKLIRYSNSEDLLFRGDSVTWKEIRDVMEFDFPTAGGQKLFVQFAESKDGEKSEVYHVTFVVDAFSTSKGFTIEDGSGLVRRRNVTVNIDVPANAWRMRLSSKEDDLSIAASLLPAPVVQYTFPQIFGNTGLQANGFYELYLQFEDAQGQKSEVYKGSTYLEVFPRTNDVFTINDGAPSTPFRTVKLSIRVPPAARKMRIFETTPSAGNSSGGSENPSQFQLLLEAAPEIFYTFNGIGTRTLYLLFTDIEGASSPVYQQLIRVEVNGVADFNIVGGNYSISRALRIELFAPPHVAAFRVFENPLDSFSTPWRAMAPWIDYISPLHGFRTIYVQYQTVDRDTLDTIAKTVFIEPFPSGTYDFNFAPSAIEILPDALIGTQLLTRSQVLPVLIDPPVAAAEMAIVEANFIDWRFYEGWRPLAVDSNGAPLPTVVDLNLTSQTGIKAVSVRFRTHDGLLSPVITKIVYFDPFFAPPTRVRINNGAMTTTAATVTLNYSIGAIPTNQQLFVRSADSSTDLENRPWTILSAVSESYSIPNTLGQHTVYVQFKLGNTESSVFSPSIELVP